MVCPALSLLDRDCKNCVAKIKNFDSLDKNLQYQLSRLGICKGCDISLAQKAMFSDPVVFNINNSRVALRRKDVEQIMIELDKKENN